MLGFIIYSKKEKFNNVIEKFESSSELESKKPVDNKCHSNRNLKK